jgi:hypothetical protein
VETAPIRCWWKTDRTSIRVGERFALTLTCSVIETRSVTVVPTLTQLDPGALQIPPFEVVGGSRRDDVVAPPWRYIQYEYNVRFLGEGFFGQDLTIPPLSVTYAIKDASGAGRKGGTSPTSCRRSRCGVMSLVPREAADIRDASAETFADVETRQFRARGASIASVDPAGRRGRRAADRAVRLIGRRRTRQPGAVRTVPPAMVLGTCVRGLNALRADVAREGWSPALARRALALLRVAGAIAAGRTVAQGTGRAVRTGARRTRSWFAVVSSGADTPPCRPRPRRRSSRRRSENGHRPSAATRAALEQLRGSLETLRFRRVRPPVDSTADAQHRAGAGDRRGEAAALAHADGG